MVGAVDVSGLGASIDLASEVTGTLPIANGGTGLTTVGSAHEHLHTNAAADALEYASALTTQEDLLTSIFTTTSSTFVVVTGLSIVLPNRAGGMAFTSFVGCYDSTTAGANLVMAIHDDGVQDEGVVLMEQGTADRLQPLNVHSIFSLDGSTVDVRLKTSAGTATIHFSDTGSEPKFDTLEME